jgi:hypothetical protein
MADIQRIGVGNNKFESVTESVIPVFLDGFDFSSEIITFDNVYRSFDENPI